MARRGCASAGFRMIQRQKEPIYIPENPDYPTIVFDVVMRCAFGASLFFILEI